MPKFLHLAVTLGLIFASALSKAETYDIVVYGGTSSAVVAAVEAKRHEKSVILVSPDRHLGGLTSGGLGYTDSGNTATVGGLAREFYHRVYLEYQKPESWKWQKGTGKQRNWKKPSGKRPRRGNTRCFATRVPVCIECGKRFSQ